MNFTDDPKMFKRPDPAPFISLLKTKLGFCDEEKKDVEFNQD